MSDELPRRIEYSSNTPLLLFISWRIVKWVCNGEGETVCRLETKFDRSLITIIGDFLLSIYICFFEHLFFITSILSLIKNISSHKRRMFKFKFDIKGRKLLHFFVAIRIDDISGPLVEHIPLVQTNK